MTDPATDDILGSGQRKSHRPGDTQTPPFAWVPGPHGPMLALRSFGLAHAFLRLSEGTRQAGFGIEFTSERFVKMPAIFLDGPAHREARRASARFFTPKAVTTKHDPLIVTFADDLVSDLERRGRGSLDLLSFRMAMAVVAEVVGLTESDPRGLERHLEGFFEAPPTAATLPWWRVAAEVGKSQGRTLRFYLRDVLPAIRARRREPRDDVLSHLLGQGARHRDILMEAVMYAAAGMVTTRQFIPMAVWHLVETPPLLDRYLAAEVPERHTILHEIIRLEPVTGNLRRRTTVDVGLEHDGVRVDIPAGTLVDVQLRPANADPAAVGGCPVDLDPDRTRAPRVAPAALAFGAGHHSCPGEYLAIHESEVLLTRLLRNEVTIERAPDLVWNDLLHAYELVDFRIQVSPRA